METTRSSADNDMRKGATEDDRPDPDRLGAPGLDENGLPNDATAIAQDESARETSRRVSPRSSSGPSLSI
jgi:hypothetical protein